MRNGEPPLLNDTSGADTLPQGSRLIPVSAIRTLELRSRRSRGRRFKVGSLERPEPGGRPASDGSGDTSWKSPGGSAQPSSSATESQPQLSSLHLERRARTKVLGRENSFEKLEAETNVDTGFTVVSSEPRPSFVSRFPRNLQTHQPPSCLSTSFSGSAASKNNRIFKERVHPLSLAGQRDLGAKKMLSECPLPLPVQGEAKEAEEEFFI